MAEIFIRTVRMNVASAGCPLTVLSHSGGVELLHITCATPMFVRDTVEGVDLPLWNDASFSPTISNGLVMDNLTERILSAAYELYARRSVHGVTREQVCWRLLGSLRRSSAASSLPLMLWLRRA